VYANFDPALFLMMDGKQIQTQATSTTVPFKSEDQRIQFSNEQVATDCFRILGDTVKVETFIYSKTVSAGKVIRNDDYFVVKVKEYPAKQSPEEQSKVSEPSS
jgi:hypothetical protein